MEQQQQQQQLQSMLTELKKISNKQGLKEKLNEWVPLLAKQLESPSSTLIILCYKCMKYLSFNMNAIQFMIKYRIHWFMASSLCKGPEFTKEREQSLKLIRTWVSTTFLNPTFVFPTLLVRTFIAIADHAQDPLRYLALETLCELSLSNIEIVAMCGGIRTLCHSLISCPILDLVPWITMTLLYLFDNPNTRLYFRPGLDLEIFLSTFTAPLPTSKDFQTQLKAAACTLQCVLRHWTGLFLFSQFNKRSFSSIVSTLSLPNDEVKLVVLNVIRDLFSFNPSLYETESEQFNIKPAPLLHYQSLLLILLVDAGFIQALADLICHSSSNSMDIQQTAITLTKDLIDVSKRLLPDSMALQLQSLPQLVSSSLNFRANETQRQKAMTALAQLDWHLNKKIPQTIFSTSRLGPVPFLQPSSSTSFPSSTLLMVSNPIHATFRKSSSRSSVFSHFPLNPRNVTSTTTTSSFSSSTTTSNSTTTSSSSSSSSSSSFSSTSSIETKQWGQEWNWEAIFIFLKEELMYSSSQIQDVLNRTSFFKKLSQFFNPSKFLNFPLMSISLEKWESIFTLFLQCLLQIQDGIQFLVKQKLFNQIHKFFSLVHSPFEVASKNPFENSHDHFPRVKVYLSILALLTHSEAGLYLLQSFHFFSIFYTLLELNNKLELQEILLYKFNYSQEGHARVWLTKALTSGPNELRFSATKHLSSLLKQWKFVHCDWILSLLKQQLYDTDPSIQSLAFQLLDVSCESLECKQILAEWNPSLSHLGKTARPLLYHFISTPIGFQSILTTGFLESELKRWFETECENYVARQELLLFQNNFSSSMLSNKSLANIFGKDILETTKNYEKHRFSFLPHFYGKVTETIEGCQWLTPKGHVSIFCERIKKNTLSVSMNESCSLKAALWCIGHIGASNTGFELIEQENIIPFLCDFFFTCPSFTISGTIFYVLGLLCRTDAGMDSIDACHWACDENKNKRFCVPITPLSMPSWEPKGSFPVENQDLIYLRSEEYLHQQIILHLCNLSNHVQHHISMKALIRIKRKTPEAFIKSELIADMLYILSLYHFSWPILHFIYSLFSISDLTKTNVPSLPKRRFKLLINTMNSLFLPKGDEVVVKTNLNTLRRNLKSEVHRNQVQVPRKVTQGFQIKAAL